MKTCEFKWKLARHSGLNKLRNRQVCRRELDQYKGWTGEYLV